MPNDQVATLLVAARILQKDENRLARYRFYIAMTVLLAIAAAFVIGAWHEIQHLFGL